MNRLSILVMLIVLATSCKKSKFDSELRRIKYDGERRTYLLHVPESYDDNDESALIIAFHGGTGTARNLEEQSGLPNFSDEKGFILCTPNGLNRTWNAGECCGKAVENDVDDVGFINELIDELLEEFNIDPNRIYLTGMSNGAMMSYRLACELGERIAAIAPVAGTMVFDCNPESPVSIIQFHSYEDSNVPVEGGQGDGLSDHNNTPLDEVMNSWQVANECQTDSKEEIDAYDFFSYTNCTDSTEIQLFITHDGGHSWPGGTKPRDKADEPSTALNANEKMWEFFVSHPKRG